MNQNSRYHFLSIKHFAVHYHNREVVWGGILGENDPKGKKKHDSSRNCKKATLIRAQKVKEGIVKNDQT